MATKRDPEATRAAILEAAEQAFLTKGFAEASTADIAKRARVTKSLIHHHFGSKQQLWTEVKLRRFGQYAKGQMAMLEQSKPTAELLRESMHLYFGFLQSNPEFVRLLAWMFLECDEECMDMDQEVLSQGIETLKRAQEEGELRADVDPAHLLFCFLFLAEHWFQARFQLCRNLEWGSPDEAKDAAYFSDMVKIFFEGVLPR